MGNATPADARSLVDLAAVVDSGPDGLRDADDEMTRIGLADELIRRSQARLRELIVEARSHGVSWQSIGDALGVSRQAAFKRFSPLTEAAHEGATMTKQRIDLMDRTHDVFRHLDVGDYDAVRALMTYTCARALGKRKLMGVWSQVASSTGRLQACIDSTVQTPDGTTPLNKLANRHLAAGPIVQTTLQHETGEWIGRVAYNGSGRITGILIAPPDSQDLPF